MTWQLLESKMFAAAAYDAERRTLYLRFRDRGDVYRYFDVPPDKYREFAEAESHGRHFLAQIRDAYRFERLARLHAA